MASSEAKKLIRKYLTDEYETDRLEVKCKFPNPSKKIEQIVGLANYRDVNYFVVGVDENGPSLNPIASENIEGFVEGLERSLESQEVSPNLKYDYYTIKIYGQELFVIELDYIQQELHHIGKGMKYPYRVNSGTQMLSSDQIKAFYQSGKIPFSDEFEFASYSNKHKSLIKYTPVRKKNEVNEYSLPIPQEIRESEMVETKFGGGQKEILENFLYRIDNHEDTSSVYEGTICISQNNCNWYNRGNGRELMAAIENPSNLPNPDFEVDKYKTYSGAYVKQYTLEYQVTLTLLVEVDFTDNGLKNAYVSLIFSHRPATDEFLSSLKKTTQMLFRGWTSKEFSTQTKDIDIVTGNVKIEESGRDTCLIFIEGQQKLFTENELFIVPGFEWFYSEKEQIKGIDLDSITIYSHKNFTFGLTLYKTHSKVRT